jgi:F-type H+-transporting ATPase subunit delta
LTATQSARRYARAVLETAPAPATVRDELRAIAATLRSNGELFDALAHPALPAEKKKAIVTATFRDMSAPLPKLFDLLIERGRTHLIPEIAVQYKKAWDAANNVHEARVTTSHPIDDAGLADIRRALETAVQGSVEIETRIDQALVGGIRVEVDGRIFDGSVRARLQALRHTLLGA